MFICQTQKKTQTQSEFKKNKKKEKEKCLLSDRSPSSGQINDFSK